MKGNLYITGVELLAPLLHQQKKSYFPNCSHYVTIMNVLLCLLKKIRVVLAIKGCYGEQQNP